MTMRERIARAIDPQAFEFSERLAREFATTLAEENSLTESAFARAIYRAMLAAAGEPE